ncbi:FAD-dependent oxidoreductase [bacterium Scap17]|nr:FAD-dependent oxidoreductase [bacterium Scap17]
MSAPIVIVGSGLAGYTVARELRKRDSSTPLVMLTEDDGAFYSKPLLSNALAKGTSADALVSADCDSMAAQLNMRILPFSRLVSIEPTQHQLVCEGQRLDYRALVLAVGAEATTLAIPGIDLPGVLSVNSLTDYRPFREQLEVAERVLIMGAGLIGCEFANDLLAAGKQVELVDPLASPLAALVPERAGQALATALTQAGAHFHMGRRVASLAPSQGRLQASLSDGQTTEVDLVLGAVGLTPRTGLARTAGLRCGRGICTDAQLATSEPDIYALGDCAEVQGLWQPYVIPLMSAARALAATLTGQPTAMSYPPMPIIVKTPVCPMVVLPPPAVVGEWHWQGTGVDLQGEFRDSQGALRGFVLSGVQVAQRQALLKVLHYSDNNEQHSSLA